MNGDPASLLADSVDTLLYPLLSIGSHLRFPVDLSVPIAQYHRVPLIVSVAQSPIVAMPTTKEPPRITHVSWGRLDIENGSENGTQSFKDAKLYPGGARAWDWNETGTSHTPGIQPADVEELLEHGASVVVLSRGMNRRLQVQSETLEMLDEAGVETHVLETEQAVERYNELQAAEEPVGGLFHSTC